MKRFASRKAIVVAAATVGVVVFGAGIAVGASTAVRDTTSVRLRVIQSEFADGFDSGWHIHPGPAIVQVQEGYFKIFQGSCEPTVVQKGQTYIEVPFVPVRVVAKGEIKWTTSQVLPSADPPLTMVASPCP